MMINKASRGWFMPPPCERDAFSTATYYKTMKKVNDMNYTNCWLSYPLVVDEKGKNLTVISEFTGPVADSALAARLDAKRQADARKVLEKDAALAAELNKDQ